MEKKEPVPDEVRKWYSNMGKKGSATTVKRYGTEKMKEWGHLGGRPRKKT